MERLRLARRSIFAACLVMALGQLSALTPDWETCWVSERKDHLCRSGGESARPFRQYLSGLNWALQGDVFSQSVRWYLRDSSGDGKVRVTWRAVEGAQATEVRRLLYSLGPDVIADVTVVQVGPDSFLPVMKWSCDVLPAQGPKPVIHRVGNFSVLVIEKDFGGNVPEVVIWAWTLTPNGPVRLRVPEAVASAIDRVAPGHRGYQTSLDWTKMYLRTWTWSGDYPGKTGVRETVDAWFTLTNDGLVVRQVEFRLDGGSVRTWPK